MLCKVLTLAILYTMALKPVCGQAERQPQDKEKPPNTKTTETQRDQRGTKESPIFVDLEQHPQSQADAAKAEKENKRKESNDLLVTWSAIIAAVCTGLLVIVGWFGVSAALRTLRVIRLQTDTLISGQRGWVLVDSIGEPTLYENIERPEMFSVLAGTPFIVFNLKAVGGTVVKLVDSGARFHLRDKKEGVEREPDLPEEPDYKVSSKASRQLPQSGFVKAPNEGFQIGIELENGPLTREQFAAVNDQRLFVCAYGFVAYEDAFRQSHETRFCYIYRVSRRSAIHATTGKNVYPSRFVIGGPTAYNRYTKDQGKAN
jgi:hypothetical protein